MPYTSPFGCGDTIITQYASLTDTSLQLHQSHLSSLSLPFPSADLHIPYLVRPGRQTFDSAIEEWAQVCGAELLDDFEGVGVGKAVIRLSAEKGDGELSHRIPSPPPF